jgi:hypothetical protein
MASGAHHARVRIGKVNRPLRQPGRHERLAVARQHTPERVAPPLAGLVGGQVNPVVRLKPPESLEQTVLRSREIGRACCSRWFSSSRRTTRDHSRRPSGVRTFGKHGVHSGSTTADGRDGMGAEVAHPRSAERRVSDLGLPSVRRRSDRSPCESVGSDPRRARQCPAARRAVTTTWSRSSTTATLMRCSRAHRSFQPAPVAAYSSTRACISAFRSSIGSSRS